MKIEKKNLVKYRIHDRLTVAERMQCSQPPTENSDRTRGAHPVEIVFSSIRFISISTSTKCDSSISAMFSFSNTTLVHVVIRVVWIEPSIRFHGLY